MKNTEKTWKMGWGRNGKTSLTRGHNWPLRWGREWGRNNGKTSRRRGHNWPFRCLDLQILEDTIALTQLCWPRKVKSIHLIISPPTIICQFMIRLFVWLFSCRVPRAELVGGGLVGLCINYDTCSHPGHCCPQAVELIKSITDTTRGLQCGTLCWPH